MVKPATLHGYSHQYTLDCERVLVTLLRGLRQRQASDVIEQLLRRVEDAKVA